ncbi:hypothetical protein WJX81_008157 [Elliptochloris bilobata]|uniref:Large ribosomal subunit protein bL28c n=1 Tax=Elliptochloris bilobata TaxID=381761 RepID=A0AAW1RLZ6_9CHLO
MSIAALKPPAPALGSCASACRGLTAALQRLSVAPSTSGRRLGLSVEASRVCQLTGAKANNGYVVTFSHKRNKKLQEVNLQYKRVYWPEEQRWVRLRISARAMRTVEKNGLQATAKKVGLDLFSLPYTDARKQRLEWLSAQPGHPPQAKDRVGKSRRMKNPEKLAASTKKPLVARYILGGRVILTRDPEYVAEYREK